MFQNKCEDAWDKLANLEEIRAKLELDLQVLILLPLSI
jgi:hypothetical protein